MTENTPAPDPIVALLQTARRARQNGDHAGARALLHAITARRPDDVRGWLLLATVAANRTEQRHALERVLALDPTNQAARRALEAMTAAQPIEPAPTIAPPVEQTSTFSEPDEEEYASDEPARTVRWPLYAVLGLAFTVIFVSGLLIWQQQQAQFSPATPLPASAAIATTTPLPAGAIATAANTTAPTDAPAIAATELPTVAPILTSPPEPTPQPSAAPIVAPTAEPPPQPTATPAINFAQFQQQDGWNVSLLKPNDAVVLSGSIGQLQPQGRFVLALVTVSNQASSERQLPVDLLTLVDGQGNRYAPIPAASTAYLQAYGEGQAGVVSMESSIAPGDVVASVPLIFDVPEAARNLQLTVNQASAGWSVGG